MTHHLGYQTGDPAGRGSGNSRNGSTAKTVTTVNGPVDITVPRDRNGSFEPVIVPKKTRRLNNINSVVLSLYSRGMTTRDIEAHLAEVYGAAVSREFISNVTEVVVDEIKARTAVMVVWPHIGPIRRRSTKIGLQILNVYSSVDMRGSLVARAGIEPATFRFSGGRSYQLSYLAGRHRCASP